jgi:hypothetical protein
LKALPEARVQSSATRLCNAAPPTGLTSRAPLGEECAAHPRVQRVKPVPPRIAPPRALFAAVDTGYDVKPFNAEALLPQVMWKDPGECLEEFVPGSQMPAAVWLGM